MSKQVILTGIRANNDLHLGNYLGALLPMVDMAKKHGGEYQVNLFVPDLHSITTPVDYGKLPGQIMQNLRVFVAAGLPLNDPNIHLYRQSRISAHSELTVILNCFTGFGSLYRMTQFKDKATKLANQSLLGKAFQVDEERGVGTSSEDVILESMTAGLFDYPVLMAADILLYGATYVPVGDDQKQHLEFTREIAKRMNSRFGDELFLAPKPPKEQQGFFGGEKGLRVRDLVDPTKKMSKSDESGKGVIFLSDTPEEVKSKILAATTDSLASVKYDYETQPGISNLLDLLKLFGGDPNEFIGQSQYGPLKEKVAGVVADFIREFQAKLANVDDKEIMAKLDTSEKEMNVQANATLLKVQKAIGLRA